LIICAQNARISAQKALKNAHFCTCALIGLTAFAAEIYIIFWRNSHLTKCPIASPEIPVINLKTRISPKNQSKIIRKNPIFLKIRLKLIQK